MQYTMFLIMQGLHPINLFESRVPGATGYPAGV